MHFRQRLFFGISTAASSQRELTAATGDLTVTREGERWRLDAESLSGLEAGEKEVSATTGTVLANVGDTPVAVVRQVGGGWAVYLNVFYERYGRERRRDFGGEAYRSLVRAILARRGVRPEVEVLGADGKPLAQAYVARYSIGESRVLAQTGQTC